MSASQTASAPFNDTRADIILRTSDGMNFHVFNIILSLASPIFIDMFKTSHPAFGCKLPIVTISEDSKTLDLALRHLYPVKSLLVQGSSYAMLASSLNLRANTEWRSWMA